MEYSAKGLEMQEAVKSYMDDFIYPNEEEYYAEQAELDNPHGTPTIMEKLKAGAKERGLWNLFIPHLDPQAPGTKLSNLDYSPISEQLGKVPVLVRGPQLLRSGHRQHGDPEPVRIGAGEGALALAVAGG